MCPAVSHSLSFPVTLAVCPALISATWSLFKCLCSPIFGSPSLSSFQPFSHVSHELLWASVLPVDWTYPLPSAFVGLVFLFLASPPQSSINLVCFVVELLNCIRSLSRVCIWVQLCFWCLWHTNCDTYKLCMQVQHNLLFFDTPAPKKLSYQTLSLCLNLLPKIWHRSLTTL